MNLQHSQCSVLEENTEVQTGCDMGHALRLTYGGGPLQIFLEDELNLDNPLTGVRSLEACRQLTLTITEA